MKGLRNPSIVSTESQQGKLLVPLATRKRASQVATHPDQPRVSHRINDNYCLNVTVCAQRLTSSKETVKSCQDKETVTFC